MNLPDELVEQIDRFIADNEWGYRSRAEVAASAVRAFLGEHGTLTRSQLRELEDRVDALKRKTE